MDFGAIADFIKSVGLPTALVLYFIWQDSKRSERTARAFELLNQRQHELQIETTKVQFETTKALTLVVTFQETQLTVSRAFQEKQSTLLKECVLVLERITLKLVSPQQP